MMFFTYPILSIRLFDYNHIRQQAEVPTNKINLPVIFRYRVRNQSMLQNFPIGKICMANPVQKQQSIRTFNYMKNNN